jgi:hypothetical protein
MLAGLCVYTLDDCVQNELAQSWQALDSDGRVSFRDDLAEGGHEVVGMHEVAVRSLGLTRNAPPSAAEEEPTRDTDDQYDHGSCDQPDRDAHVFPAK